ncbi:1554_t:CDS:2, partial [Dentiscutata erythropus]
MAHNESTSNFKNLSNLEFGNSTHVLESDEPIYDFEFNGPICDSVVVQENKDIELGSSKEKPYEEMKGRVKKNSNGIIRKRTMLCEHSGEYKPKNTQLTKETSTKYIKCPWHINLSQPQKNNPNGNVYITILDNTHNYDLSSYRTKFFNDSELTQEMYERVEFYMNAIKLKLLQIQSALRKEFPNHEVYFSEIHKATAKYYSEKRKDILR